MPFPEGVCMRKALRSTPIRLLVFSSSLGFRVEFRV